MQCAYLTVSQSDESISCLSRNLLPNSWTLPSRRLPRPSPSFLLALGLCENGRERERTARRRAGLVYILLASPDLTRRENPTLSVSLSLSLLPSALLSPFQKLEFSDITLTHTLMSKFLMSKAASGAFFSSIFIPWAESRKTCPRNL